MIRFHYHKHMDLSLEHKSCDISHVIHQSRDLDPVITPKKTISAQNSEVDTEENGQEAPESTICTVTRADSMGTLAQGTFELYIMTSLI